jgi:hypothetical protein
MRLLYYDAWNSKKLKNGGHLQRINFHWLCTKYTNKVERYKIIHHV